MKGHAKMSNDKNYFELGLPMDSAYIPSAETTALYVATTLGLTFDKAEEVKYAVSENCKEFIKYYAIHKEADNNKYKVSFYGDTNSLYVTFTYKTDNEKMLFDYTPNIDLFKNLMDDFEYNINNHRLNIKMSKKLLYT